MRDIPGPTPGQEVTTPSSAGEAAAASADTSSHSTRHFACDLTMHSASLIPLRVCLHLLLRCFAARSRALCCRLSSGLMAAGTARGGALVPALVAALAVSGSGGGGGATEGGGSHSRWC